MILEWLIGFEVLTIAMRLVTSGTFYLFTGMEKVLESPSAPPPLVGTTIIYLLVIIAASYESFIENRKTRQLRRQKNDS